MPIVWNLFSFWLLTLCHELLFYCICFILLMATVFLSIATGFTECSLSKKLSSLSYWMVKANNRTFALFLKIWEESEHHWKFLSLLFKCHLSSLSIAIYSKQFGWVGVGGGGAGGCFWGRPGERRRRVGDRDMGGGEGASVSFGCRPRSVCNQTDTKWITHSF